MLRSSLRRNNKMVTVARVMSTFSSFATKDSCCARNKHLEKITRIILAIIVRSILNQHIENKLPTKLGLSLKTEKIHKAVVFGASS